MDLGKGGQKQGKRRVLQGRVSRALKGREGQGGEEGRTAPKQGTWRHFGGGWSVPAAGTLLSCLPLARPFLGRSSQQACRCPPGDSTATSERTCLPSAAGSSASDSSGSATRSDWHGPSGAGSGAQDSGGSGGAGAPGTSAGAVLSGAGARAAPRRNSSQASSSASAVTSAGSAASSSAGDSIAPWPPSGRQPGPRGSPPRPAATPRPGAEFRQAHAPRTLRVIRSSDLGRR